MTHKEQMEKGCRPVMLVDCGGTNTRWWVVGSDEACSGLRNRTALTEGANATVSSARDIAALALEAKSRTGLSDPSVIHYYGAGCAAADARAMVAESLAEVWPYAEIAVHTDILGAARGLLGHVPGIACILGTGSNSCLYDGREITANVPTVGYILGDPGSGASIGRRLVADLIQSRMPDRLSEEFLMEYPISRDEALGNVYRRSGGNAWLGQFVRFLNGRTQEEYVSALLAEEFDAFFDRQVLPYPGSRDLPLCFTGSVAVHMADALRDSATRKGLVIEKIVSNLEYGLKEYHTEDIQG